MNDNQKRKPARFIPLPDQQSRVLCPECGGDIGILEKTATGYALEFCLGYEEKVQGVVHHSKREGVRAPRVRQFLKQFREEDPAIIIANLPMARYADGQPVIGPLVIEEFPVLVYCHDCQFCSKIKPSGGNLRA